MGLNRILQRFRSQKMMSMLSSLSGAAMGIITFALLARALSKADFGIFSFYLAAHTVAEMLRNGLVGKPLIKFVAESDDDHRKNAVIGSAWRLGLRSSIIMGVMGTLGFGLFYLLQPTEELLLYTVFFFPIMLISLPHNVATWVLNARLRFDKMIWIRTSLQAVYIIGVALAYLMDYSLWFVFLVFALANLTPSLISLIAGWDGIRYWSKAQRALRKELVDFGRYSMGTLLGGSFLRSSDNFIIRIFLGPEALAIYQVPQRLVNLIDIPLRALVSFSFPALARENRQKGGSHFKTEFERSAGLAFLLLLPLAIGSFIFAEPLVVLLGGADYAEAATILRVFSVYMAITSIDRYAGVALDVLNMPQVNMGKVMLMLGINIVGDIIAVQLSNDVSWVAFISIFTFSGGIVFGFYSLRKILPFNGFRWLKYGGNEVFRIVKKLVSK